jgi:hypothetical protein
LGRYADVFLDDSGGADFLLFSPDHHLATVKDVASQI